MIDFGGSSNQSTSIRIVAEGLGLANIERRDESLVLTTCDVMHLSIPGLVGSELP